MELNAISAGRGDDLVQNLRVEARPGPENQCLDDGGGVGQRDQVVDQLRRIPRSRGTDVENLLADVSKRPLTFSNTAISPPTMNVALCAATSGGGLPTGASRKSAPTPFTFSAIFFETEGKQVVVSTTIWPCFSVDRTPLTPT